MKMVVTILFLLVILVLIVSLFNPSVINKIKANPTRKDVIVLLGLPAIILLILLAAIAPPINYYKKGLIAYKNGNYEESLNQFNKIKVDDKDYKNSLEKIEEVKKIIENKKDKKSNDSLIAPIKSDIVVGFLSLKKENEIYRYFFNYKNNGSEDFNGKINIILIAKNGHKNNCEPILGKIKSGNGSFLFFDKSTGTPSTHGDYGIIGFEYEVIDNNGKKYNKGFIRIEV